MTVIYEIIGISFYDTNDNDNLILMNQEVLSYSNMFTSKVNAIAKAQSLFAKNRADWVRVFAYSINEHGVSYRKRIYNKYKSNINLR